MADELRPSAQYDVAVIGAGPAGTTTAALLEASGLDVAIFERSRFPRFCIGESLLPICNDVLREAGLFDVVAARGYQVKTGAVFLRGRDRCEFDFAEQFGDGATWTWQVPRADFDKVLAEAVCARGVPIFFEHTVTKVDVGAAPRLTVEARDGRCEEVNARFIVDASGFGRVLPRLLDLEEPSDQPLRQAMFTHVRGDRRPKGANSGGVVIDIPDPDVWIWIIPFAGERSSVGVVAPPEWFDALPSDPSARFRAALGAATATQARLGGMPWPSFQRAALRMRSSASSQGRPSIGQSTTASTWRGGWTPSEPTSTPGTTGASTRSSLRSR